MSKELQIRNSTAEFLIFQAEDKAQGVQVFYKDETIWASQKAIAALFDVDRSVITKHLKNIFETGELQPDSVSAKFAHTAERMAKRHIPMTMEDWAKRIDIILEAGGDKILTDAGHATAEQAKEFAEAEFEKYRVIQDRLYESDFDLFTLPALPTDEQKD